MMEGNSEASAYKQAHQTVLLFTYHDNGCELRQLTVDDFRFLVFCRSRGRFVWSTFMGLVAKSLRSATNIWAYDCAAAGQHHGGSVNRSPFSVSWNGLLELIFHSGSRPAKLWYLMSLLSCI